MDEFLRVVAKPYVFLFREGGLTIFLSILFSSFAFGYFYDVAAGDILILIKNFLSVFYNPSIVLLRVVFFLILFLVLNYLLLKTFFKYLNNVFFNSISVFFLLIILYDFSHTLCYIIILIGVLLFLYKYLVKKGDFIFDTVGTPYGDSRWSKFRELKEAGLDDQKGFLLGRDNSTGEIIGFKGEGHVLTIAKTGSGKGVSVVVPNLLHYDGPVVVIDPKGENFIRSVYARSQKFNQEICLVDPFGEVYKNIERQINRLSVLEKQKELDSNAQSIMTFYKDLKEKVKPPMEKIALSGEFTKPGDYNCGFNPLGLLQKLVDEENFQEVFDQANVIANMLVVKGNEPDPHWNEKAKMIIKNTIVFLCLHEDYKTEPKTLIEVRDTILEIFEDEASFEGFIKHCKNSSHSKFLNKIASEFSLNARDERLSILSAVLRHLEFLDSPLVTYNLTRSETNFLDIKTKEKSIYFVLPANKLDAYSRLMRLWISSIINSISIDTNIPLKRILMIVDEAAQLGKMEPLIQAVSLLRGYGLNLWMIFQDISQLKDIYGDNQWKTFSSNAKFQQFFGVSDHDTASYVSDLSGMTTITTRDESFQAHEKGSSNNSVSYSYRSQERKLLYPDQLYRTSLQFLFTEGLFPIKARKIKFYNDGLFVPGEHLPFQLQDQYKSFF
jgi:type IV secretion system protein VirD4